LKATVSPDNATDKTVTWSTSDTSIATVDNNGVVKAIKVGKVTITAKAGDKTATCEVTVKPVLVSGIVLDKISVELFEGETITLTATVSPDNATDKTVTWSTSDATIATVDNNGVVKAIKVGKVTITAKAGDKTATCEVTVKPIPVIEITLDKTTAELVEGESLTIVATVSPDNATDKTVTWSTSDASIATVDNNCVVKAIKAGKVTITAEAGGLTATCEITVVGKETDGIDEVMTLGNLDIYDIRGRLVKKSATSFDALPKGIYIVNGKKISVK
jgi:alpha-L-fucosidase 2